MKFLIEVFLNLISALCFDTEDLNYYYNLFANLAKRNPTTVELFDLAQSNSEHSRHWFFRGELIVDGEKRKTTLFQDVTNTQKHSNQNNVIKFCDNSSGIEGHQVEVLMPIDPTQPSAFDFVNMRRHIIYTAETHNFPTAVCPFPGAATGTGGRIRDVEAAGRGGHVLAGISAYCVGNLNIPGYDLPWERKDLMYPSNFAKPLNVLIEASNGASDYGNKFGEPVIAGFARSFGIFDDESNERYEYVKPIMFSGGIGTIDDSQLRKRPPEKGSI